MVILMMRCTAWRYRVLAWWTMFGNTVVRLWLIVIVDWLIVSVVISGDVSVIVVIVLNVVIVVNVMPLGVALPIRSVSRPQRERSLWSSRGWSSLFHSMASCHQKLLWGTRRASRFRRCRGKTWVKNREIQKKNGKSWKLNPIFNY